MEGMLPIDIAKSHIMAAEPPLGVLPSFSAIWMISRPKMNANCSREEHKPATMQTKILAVEE